MTINSNVVRTLAFIDSGGNSFGFIDSNFVQSLALTPLKLSTPRILRVVDGRESSAGMVTHFLRTSIQIGHHSESADLFVTRLSQYPIILGYGWLARHNPLINWTTRSVKFNSNYCKKSCYKPAGGDNSNLNLNLSKVALTNGKLATPSPKDTSDLEAENLKLRLPDWLHHQLSVFSKLESDVLPPHRSIDHKIVLKEGAQPPFGRLYGMSQEELSTLRKWLQENLDKGFIRPSSSPAASPVLFVKKSDGRLRLCMDYRALNAVTVKNRYPLPLISETLDRLSKAKYFTKLDVIAAFNRIRIAKGDEWKSAFRTRYGLFESLVMPFGLTNAPSTFQNYINSTLQEYLDVFCTAYIDDVLTGV